MNCGLAETRELLRDLKQRINGEPENVEILVCPPFVSLPAAAGCLKESSIQLGAQNVNFENNGAYTGEISTVMLTEIDCEYVIVGHSERRDYFVETDEMINLKTKKTLESGMKPIICVGEFLWQREENQHQTIAENQVKAALKNVDNKSIKDVVIAYEPIWAIGTGETATPEQAEKMHKVIRSTIKTLYGQEASEAVQILYGGSMKPGNADELLSQPNVDGGLIGGASLKADSFTDIINTAKKIV